MEKKYKIGMYINVALTIIALLVVLAPMLGIGRTDNPPKAPETQVQIDAPENEIPEMPAEGAPESNNAGKYVAVITYVSLIALVAYYAIIGYKKPHGNLLRWTMLVFAISQILLLSKKLDQGPDNAVYIQSFVILCTAYMAGRLNKIEKNKYIAVLILVLLIYIFFIADIGLSKTSVMKTLGALTPTVIWIDICFAYFIRYAEHKESGLEDAPRK